jgi:hypothetical protein
MLRLKRKSYSFHPTRTHQPSVLSYLCLSQLLCPSPAYMSPPYQLTSANPNAPDVAFSSSPSPVVSRPVSRTSSRAASQDPSFELRANGVSRHTHGAQRLLQVVDDEDSDLDEMEDRRPPLHRPDGGRSHQPLLHKDDEERGRPGYDTSPDPPDRPPMFSRRSTMRSRSPDTQAKLATRKKYTYATFFLGLSLISFVVQTETAVYIQHELGWNKAYCML